MIAVSAPLRDLALRTWPAGPIEVVPNGVDTDRFHPLAETRVERSDGRIVLMAVARLVEFKGLQHLIAALAQLPPDVRARVFLSLCGTGPYEGELRRQAREAGLEAQVEFAGLVPYEEIPARLREADGFVLPSLKEGLPLSLLEAMASGLPVLASAVGGIPDLVRDGVNGLLAPAGDVPALREALLRLAGAPDLRARLGESARRTVMAWSWASIWERYEALFSESCRSQGVAQCG